MIEVPDISTYQESSSIPGQINFFRMRSLTQAVIIRAGQNLWRDQDFDINWRNAKAAGLRRGSYWFYDSRVSPNKQADLWREIIGSDLPECGLWMDFEESYDGIYRHEGSIMQFAALVRTVFPSSIPIGVYTAYYWWVNRVMEYRNYFKIFPLWVANYGTNTPMIPPPWTNWFLHQYTSSGDGLAYGVESKEIDLNRYNGTWEQFFAAFGTVPAPPPIGDKMNVYEVIITGLRIRYSPPLDADTLGADAGKVMSRGDRFESDLTGAFGWLRITKWIKPGGVEVLPPAGREWWCSGSASYVKLISVPPPPPAPVTLKSANMNLDPVTGKVKTTYTYSDATTKVLDS